MSDNRLYKHMSTDKWEAYLATRKNFIHDDYYVSNYQELFHMPSGYGSRHNGRGFRFGVQKRIEYVSGKGICVDSQYMGMTDQ